MLRFLRDGLCGCAMQKSWCSALVSILLCGATVHAQDLSDPDVPLPENAQLGSAEWRTSVAEWLLETRNLSGGVRSFRESLSDLIATMKGWTLIEEKMYFLVLMDSDILFDFDSATIRAAARDPLVNLAEVLVPYEVKELLITGHTDSKGTDAYNNTLSLRRAQSVEALMRSTKLLDAWRFSTTGRGERDPIAPNESSEGKDNPSGREKNRRVELRIKKKG